MKIKKGDTVLVTTGKDKGKKGKVLRAFPSTSKVLVEGINMSKKHKKPANGQKGSTVEVSSPMHVSNVTLLDPKSGKATRVGYKMVGDKKVRIAKKSGQEI